MAAAAHLAAKQWMLTRLSNKSMHCHGQLLLAHLTGCHRHNTKAVVSCSSTTLYCIAAFQTHETEYKAVSVL